jgi:hypothetical protein
MTHTPKPHLVLSYVDILPERLFEPFKDAIQAPGLDVLVEQRPMRPQAGIHWLIPTAVVLYITKSYFDGYLKEVGKEHYQVLKKAMSSFWSSFFGENRAVLATVVGTPGKLAADHEKYSLMISVVAEANSGLRFKLLFEDALSTQEFNLAVAQFLDFLQDYYAGSLDSTTMSRLASTREVGKTILATYDRASGEFLFLDPIGTTTTE